MDTLLYKQMIKSFMRTPGAGLIIVSIFLFLSGCAANSPFQANTDHESPLKALDSFDPDKREKAAETLGSIGPVKHRHISSQLKRLMINDDQIRAEAVNSIAETGVNLTGIVDALCNSLTDADSKVREASAESLGLLNRELASAVYPLETTIEELESSGQNKLLTYAANRAYVIIRPLSVKIEKALLESMNDPNQDVADAASSGILGIETGKSEKLIAATESIKTPESEKTTAPDVEENTAVALVEAGSVVADESEIQEEVEVKSIETLISELDNFDAEIRRQASASIGARYSDQRKEIREYIRILKNGDVSNRTDAADAISGIGSEMENSVSALCRSMEDVSEQVRSASAHSLGIIIGILSSTLKPMENSYLELDSAFRKNKESNDDGIMKLYLDNFKKSYSKAEDTIQSIRDQGVPALASRLDDENYLVRNSVAEALKEINPGLASQDDTVSGRKNKKESVKISEVDTGNDTQTDEVDLSVMLLITDLGNTNISVARKAAVKLGQMGSKAAGAVPALVRAIENDTNWHDHYKYVRVDAIKALGLIGSNQKLVIDTLLKKLTHINYEIRKEAVVALGRIPVSSEAVLKQLITIIEKEEIVSVREVAITSLGNCDPEPLLDKCYITLFRALKDQNGTIRLNAFRGLATYEAKNLGKGLIKWKALKANVDGYRVCVNYTDENYMQCIDTGKITAIRPIRFEKFQKDKCSIDVKGRKGQRLYDVKWTHVNIRKILSRAAEFEKDPKIQKEKNKALDHLVKSLGDKSLQSGLVSIQ